MTQADKITALCTAIDRQAEQIGELCESIEQLGVNLLHAQALAGAAMTTHLVGKKGKDALEHAANLYELYMDLIAGESELTREMAAKVIGTTE